MKQIFERQFTKLEQLKKRNQSLTKKLTGVTEDSEHAFDVFCEVVEESLAIQKEMVVVVENIKNLLEQEEGQAS